MGAYWTIVMDDGCPLVRKLGRLIQLWDRNGNFRLIGKTSLDSDSTDLMHELLNSPWSIMLVNKDGQTWLGPEAIPFILKNLPSGRLAAVTYTIPGTMWLTHKIYNLASRNKQVLSPATAPKTDFLNA